jgi:MFS family permease
MRRVFFGWKVVAVSFLIAIYAWGLGFYGPSIYVNELVKSRDWSVATVSGAVTFHFLFSAAIVVFLADLHARFGVVAVTRIGVLVFGIGAVGFATAAEPWHLYLAAMATGFGWSTTSGAAINTFVSTWFEKRRPLALSHAYNGASLGGVIMTPVWVGLIGAFGFVMAAVIIAAAGTILLSLLAGRYLRPTPGELGQSIDDDPVRAAATVSATPIAPPRSRAALLRDPAILSLSIGFAIGIFAQMGLITHLVVRLAPVLGDLGAAGALSLATACAIVGRFVLAGLIGERNRRRAGAVNFLIQAAGVGLLVHGETPAPLIAGCVLFGLGIGNLLSLPPLILQSEQPSADVGRALALLTAVNQVLYAFAPGAFGLARDLTGDYTLPFLAALAIQLVSAAIVARRPRRRSTEIAS